MLLLVLGTEHLTFFQKKKITIQMCPMKMMYTLMTKITKNFPTINGFAS